MKPKSVRPEDCLNIRVQLSQSFSGVASDWLKKKDLKETPLPYVALVDNPCGTLHSAVGRLFQPFLEGR